MIKDCVACQDVVQVEVSSAESASLPLTRQCTAQSSAAFSTLCTAAEDFRLKHTNCSASLSVVTISYLGFMAFADFLSFFTIFMRG